MCLLSVVCRPARQGAALRDARRPVATMMANRLKEYRYYLSSGVSTNISIKISLVELSPVIGHSASKDGRDGSAARASGLEQLSGTSSDFRNAAVSEMFITAQIFSDGLALHPMVIRYGRWGVCVPSCVLLCSMDGVRVCACAIQLEGADQVQRVDHLLERVGLLSGAIP